MTVRKTVRREFRLSAEHRALLDRIVSERGITITAWFREKIAEEREAASRENESATASAEHKRKDSH